MKKTFYWTSNKTDTIHTLKILHDGKIVATVPRLNGKELYVVVNDLKAHGYTHE